jgi:translation initiation factor IF-3
VEVAPSRPAGLPHHGFRQVHTSRAVALDARKKQTIIQVKEAKIAEDDEHDFQFKARHVRRFLRTATAKVTIRFRGREMAHTELGRKLLDRMSQDLADLATIESFPKLEGRNLVMVLTPKQH